MAGPVSAPSQVVILGAGRGVRGGVPSAIVDIDENDRVMDWLLDAFGALDDPDVYFVGGFKADEVVERYPRLRTIFNRDWAQTGPAQSLGLVPLDTGRTTYVCYSDIVFRRSAVAALRDAPGDSTAVAIDTLWRDRYDGRSRYDLDHAEKIRLRDGLVTEVGPGVETEAATAEFAGVLRLGPAATAAAFSGLGAGALSAKATLPDLIRYLLGCGVEIRAVDLQGDWAELDAKQDLARFVLGTKAESLTRLREMSHGGEIGELLSFTHRDWLTDPRALVDRILAEIPGRQLIVRSSALSEDGWLESAAGRYESVLDVARTPEAITDAVDTVFASYATDEAENQVLVQEMLLDVAVSGVVMTRTHALGAPYYVVNFDDTSARTDTVTGGSDARTIFLHRESPLRDELRTLLGPVLSTVQHIEKLVGHDSLDIEFAVTRDGLMHILQVRPIAVTHAGTPIDDEQIARSLTQARRFLAEHRAPSPTLVGRTTRYSVMTDWNPAEIIGTKPKRLASSLYRYLITDDIWAQQRAEYGYRDVRPCPLLIDIVGHPYVDVRATFNSFVPATLPDDLARRLVEHYLAVLEEQPVLHDKVEFDVLFTCLTPDFDARSSRLRDAGFSETDIAALREALCTVTAQGFGRVDADLAQLPVLDARVRDIRSSPLPPLERAYLFLETARRFGTLTFSHLARAAFVATSLLRSMEDLGVIPRDENDAFLSSIETVLGRLQSDGRAVQRGTLGWDAFVEEYGHLRPGTYDLTSPCYRAEAEEYLRPVVDAPADAEGATAQTWSDDTRRAISDTLRETGLPDDVDRFESFVRHAIAGREEGKFVFTRALSDALECLAEFGASVGMTRDDLAHIGIHDLFACRQVMSDPGAFLARRVLEGRDAYHVAQGVSLPGQIADDVDLVCFEQQAAEPNFVTQHTVEAAAVAAPLTPDVDVDGAIVLIPNADPGYDWLLARDIAGLVTMYGGANSHMAVRAAELSLPAAIGVGELQYRELESATVIRLDCASRTIMARR